MPTISIRTASLKTGVPLTCCNGVICLAVIPHEVIIAYTLDCGTCGYKLSRVFACLPFHCTYDDVAVLDDGIPVLVKTVILVEVGTGINRKIADMDVCIKVVGISFIFGYQLCIADNLIVSTGFDVVQSVIEYSCVFFLCLRQNLSLRLDIQEVLAAREKKSQYNYICLS